MGARLETTTLWALVPMDSNAHAADSGESHPHATHRTESARDAFRIIEGFPFGQGLRGGAAATLMPRPQARARRPRRGDPPASTPDFTAVVAAAATTADWMSPL